MQNQEELTFGEVMLAQNEHLKLSKLRMNSRYSRSYELDIDLIDTIIDEELQLQFCEVTYAIRLSAPILNYKQKQESIVLAKERVEDLPSQSIEIEIEDEKQREKQSPVLQEQKAPQLNIPQIRLSSIIKQAFSMHKLVTVLMVLTSAKEIDKIRISLEGSKVNEEITHCKVSGFYKDTYIAVCLMNVDLNDFKRLVVKYNEVSNSLLFFSRKMENEISFEEVIVYQNVGFLFPEVMEVTPNQQLINYSILLAQEHLSMNIVYLLKVNPKVITQFYFIFLRYFEPHQANIDTTFNLYELQPINPYNTEFFLYFLYMIYRENAINKIYEFSLLPKLEIHRRCIRILTSKYYDLFDNGQCFKEFLFYVYFLNISAYYPSEFDLVKSVAKYNILHQNEIQSRRVLLKLEPVNERLLIVANNSAVNAKMISNKEISFCEYFEIRLKGLRRMIREESSRAQSNMQAENLPLIKFLSDLIEKMKVNMPPRNEMFLKFQPLVSEIYLQKGKLRIKQADLAEFFAKIKFLYKCSQALGNLFFNPLKSAIFERIPQLLRSSYETVVHPLVMKPQSSQQNKFLLDFFQNEKLQTSSVIFLLKIWLQMKIQLYNFLTIQFILLKFMAVNKSFEQIDINELMFTIAEHAKRRDLTEARKKSISRFCYRMKDEMQEHEGKQDFQNWLHQLFRQH